MLSGKQIKIISLPIKLGHIVLGNDLSAHKSLTKHELRMCSVSHCILDCRKSSGEESSGSGERRWIRRGPSCSLTESVKGSSLLKSPGRIKVGGTDFCSLWSLKRVHRRTKTFVLLPGVPEYFSGWVDIKIVPSCPGLTFCILYGLDPSVFPRPCLIFPCSLQSIALILFCELRNLEERLVYS